MTCRRSVVLMLMLLEACSATFAHAASPGKAARAVSIRIHDYSRLDQQQLQNAQRQVSRIYERIGVRLDWRGVVRPADAMRGLTTWPSERAMLTVVVLAADMADRLQIPPDVAGYAPITRAQGGRVAYVVGDRTAAIARSGHVSQAKVLAGIISHELAHLLMPERSHSLEGVMRAHWDPTEFHDVDQQRFSPAEASSIRRMVDALDGTASSRVAD